MKKLMVFVMMMFLLTGCSSGKRPLYLYETFGDDMRNIAGKKPERIVTDQETINDEETIRKLSEAFEEIIVGPESSDASGAEYDVVFVFDGRETVVSFKGNLSKEESGGKYRYFELPGSESFFELLESLSE